jgi:protein ImuB
MYAVLRIPGFALEAILRVEPALAGQPVALAGIAGRGTEIADCNDRARQAGVEPGSTVPQAQARCAALVVRTPRAELEREAAEALRAVAFGITAYVEATAPGVCTLGLEKLPAERHEAALRAALARLADFGLPAGAGTGATPQLALYAARHAATGEVRPSDPAFLAALPVAAADPPAELQPILAAWGIRTLGQLTALSKADVTQRLGRTGLALWERAAGGSARPLAVVEPAHEFVAHFASEHELETLEPLLFVLRRAVDRLALELAQAHRAAVSMELTLDLADAAPYGQSLRLPEPVTDPGILFRTLQTHLETVRTSAAVVGFRLRIEPGRIGVRQQGLFDGGLRDPHGFADTLARVVGLVGAERVGRPVPADTHRPDSFTLAAPPATLEPPPERYAPPLRGRPLRRFRPPLPARVLLVDAAPAQVWGGAVEGGVVAASGPWVSSGDWWESARAWRQEEWDIELATGGLYRLRRDAAGWAVEGEYD